MLIDKGRLDQAEHRTGSGLTKAETRDDVV